MGEIVRGRPADGRELERGVRIRGGERFKVDENSQYPGSGSVRYVTCARSSVNDGTFVVRNSRNNSH